MNSALQSSFSRLERQRAAILEMTGKLSPDRFHRAPAGKWSVSQILSHLVTSEQLALGYMKKKILGIERAGDSGMAESFKMAILVISQRLPLRYKAPGVILARTPEHLSWDEISAQWDDARLGLKALAGSVSEINLRKKIFKHPFLGNFDLAQGFRFFYEHIRHHAPQIKRLL